MNAATPAFLPYGRQSIDQTDIDAVVACMKGDWLTQGPTVQAFEAAIAARVGGEAVAVANGTAALHIAALALDLGPADAVIVPTVTFLATANAVRYTGAEVEFADVEADTGLTNGRLVVEAVERARMRGLRPRALFSVHMAGQPTNAGDTAQELGLEVVEDASHAFGTTRKVNSSAEAVPVGACPNGGMTTFSFHPVKTIATGEGGAVTTTDPRYAERLRRLRSHGMTRVAEEFSERHLGFDASGTVNPWYYEMSEIGFNYRISDIQCALGLSQMSRLDVFMQARQALVAAYDAALSPLAPLVMPLGRTVAGANVSWHLYVALIDFDVLGMSRGNVMAALKEAGIGSQVHYLPVHLQPYYARRYGVLKLPGADAYYRRCLSLPLYYGLTVADVARVADALKSIINR